MHKLMRLNRDVPHGVCLDKLHNRRDNLLIDAPLWLQVQQALATYFTATLHGPLQIILSLNDNLELVGTTKGLVEWWKLTLRREAYPVKLTAKGLRARCLEEYLEATSMKLSRENTQWIQQWLATSNHNGLCRARRCTLDNGAYLCRREHLRVPGVLSIAPAAANIAATKTNEVCRLTCVEALTLTSLELFDKWQ